jgi:prepilin-type N-terminal cleavage/methylation domain-containing protein
MKAQTITKCRTAALRKAFTLLEVILALAIFAGSVAVLGELIRTGLQSAEAARELSRDELLAESIMSQVLSGELANSGVSDTPCDDQPGYNYSIDSDSTGQSLTGLLKITVTVSRDLPAALHPQHFTLTRWMVDPSALQSSSSTSTSQSTSGS